MSATKYGQYRNCLAAQFPQIWWLAPFYTAMLVGATLACLATGCGTHEPSYKDRIGTVDPAKAPIMLPDSPAPKPKNRQ